MPPRSKNPIGAVQDFAAHRIEHRVDLLHPFLEARDAIVDDSIGAEPAHVGGVIRGCRGDHDGPGTLGELHCIGADIARSSMDEHGLS